MTTMVDISHLTAIGIHVRETFSALQHTGSVPLRVGSLHSLILNFYFSPFVYQELAKASDGLPLPLALQTQVSNKP